MEQQVWAYQFNWFKILAHGFGPQIRHKNVSQLLLTLIALVTIYFYKFTSLE